MTPHRERVLNRPADLESLGEDLGALPERNRPLVWMAR
jgi:hypothetical protein